MSEQKDEQREVSVELMVQCDNCGGTLEALYKPPLNSYQETNKVSGVLIVMPCSRCLDSAEEQGREDGYHKGYDMGFADGLTEEREEENDSSDSTADQTD